MSEVSKETLIVSGATGWLGMELLERLSRPVDLLSPDTILISSTSKILKISSGREFECKPYDEVVLPNKADGFVNLAFLTREKVTKFGYESFVLRNLELISQACKVIEKTKPKWVVTVSSGAVLKRGTSVVETDIKANPYGFLKRVEELLIADAARKVGATSIVGRLWGASGRFMPRHPDYALSDFLCSALDDQVVHIRSSNKVWRRQCDAGEFMGVLLALAHEGVDRTLDSGGELIEIGDLAQEVVKHFPSVSISREPANQGREDDYYSRSREFDNEASRLGIRLSSIEEQVSRTLLGHRILT